MLAVHHFAFHYIYRIHPREELFVSNANQLIALVMRQHFGRDEVAFGILAAELLGVCAQTRFCEDIDSLLTGVGVSAFYSYIVDFRTHTKGGVGRQRPGSSRPCKEIQRHVRRQSERIAIYYLKLSRTGSILHITIATGLVELVR